MSGTFAPKVVAEGQVANSKGTLYTVPASTSFYCRSIHFYNSNAATQTLNLYLKPGSTSRQVRKITLAQYESYEIDTPFVLETGDLIEADTTTASAVDYVITGVEET